MFVLYDLVVILMISLCGFIGYKKGFAKTLISFSSVLIAAVIAFFLAQPLSAGIYDSFVSEKITSEIEQKLEGSDTQEVIKGRLEDELGIKITEEDMKTISESDGDLSQRVSKIASDKGEPISDKEIDEKIEELLDKDNLKEILGGDVSDKTAQALSDALKGSGDDFEAAVAAVSNSDTQKAADSIQTEILRPKAVALISVIVMILIFVIIRLILKLVSWATSLIDVIPVANKFNTGLGLAFGFAEAVVILLLLGTAVSAAIENSYGLASFINRNVIDKTVLFRWFC